MNNKDAIKKLMEVVYKDKTTLVLTPKEINKIKNSYKNSLLKYDSFDEYLKQNEEINILISKLKNGKNELRKQYDNKKALQAGILTECNFVQSLAKAFKFNRFVDADMPFSKMPKEIKQLIGRINDGAHNMAARYIYYSAKDFDSFIVQYGNPQAGDAEIFISNNRITIEIKEPQAKGGEYDLTYHENGKLISSRKLCSEFPELMEMIDKFNNETTVFAEIGSNYNGFDRNITLSILKKYFENNHIDILLTSDKKGNLMTIEPKDLDERISNGKEIISTKSSEIRTAGRNYLGVYTPNYLQSTLEELGAEKAGADECVLKLGEKVCFVTGRGTTAITRLKINHIFFVPIKKVEQLEENTVKFCIDDVKQLKPTVSVHMNVEVLKSEILPYIKASYSLKD